METIQGSHYIKLVSFPHPEGYEKRKHGCLTFGMAEKETPGGLALGFRARKDDHIVL